MIDEPRGLTRLRRYLASEKCDLRHESDVEDESDPEDQEQDGDEDGDQDGDEDDEDEDDEDEDGDDEEDEDAEADEDEDENEDGDESCSDGDNGARDNLQAGFKDELMTDRILSAFRRARVGGGDLPIWVDALCINQKDAVEKGHQIHMMRDIYTKAGCVFSWLGPSDHKKVDLALSTIRKLSVRLHSDEYSKAQLNRDHPKLCTIHYHYPPFNKYWEAISNFAESEYFQRLWIFQELWATDEAIFLCGDEYLPMKPLLRYHDWAASILQDIIKNPSPPLIVPLFRSITQVYRIKAGFKGAPVKSRVFLDIVSGWRCKDPRDKVFALYGIFPMGITPDYTIPVAEVYGKWATNSHQDLPLGSLLFYSGIGLHPRTLGSHNLASWQPDFELLGIWTEVPTRFQPTVSPARCFTCYGVPVTKVSNVASHASKETIVKGAGKDRIPSRQSLLPILKYLLDNRRRLWSPEYHTQGSTLRAFIETVNECVDGGIPVTSDLTPEMVRAFSPYNLFREAQQQTSPGMDEPRDFAEDELKFMGLQTEKELWECLSDLSIDSGSPEVQEAKPQEPLSQFVSRMWVFALKKSVFHTEDGRMGAGPPGMQEHDLVYLIHGCSLPVLLREVEGELRHVGVCFISGISGAESFQILRDRGGDVQELKLV